MTAARPTAPPAGRSRPTAPAPNPAPPGPPAPSSHRLRPTPSARTCCHGRGHSTFPFEAGRSWPNVVGRDQQGVPNSVAKKVGWRMKAPGVGRAAASFIPSLPATNSFSLALQCQSRLAVRRELARHDLCRRYTCGTAAEFVRPAF